jgi:ABC-2 family transporter protein
VTEMVRRYLRQKFGSVGVVIALGLLAILTAFPLAASGHESSLESSGFLTLLILAAASVSKDASSGTLQMILARPIRRVDYLFGRYCGILVAYAVCLAVTAGMALVLSPLLRVLLGGGGGPLSLAGMARGAAGALLSATLFASILLLFSTFLPGYGDVLAYFLLSLLLGLPEILARPLGLPWLSKIGPVARDNVLPRVAWGEVLRGNRVLSAEVGAYALAVAAYLTLAAVIFSRREFSYGRD